jgi:3-oxoacyl-[acyl-carrier protein] reductase
MVGQGTGGSIVTVSSTMGASGGRPGFAHYAASKAGVIGLTKTLAIELGGNGIRVNCVAPGAVDTPLFRETVGEAVAKTWSKSPLGRVGEPQDIAEAIEFLLTERSSWITGQVIHVNGGVYM